MGVIMENKCFWTVDSEFGQYGHLRYMKSCDKQIEVIGEPGETVESSGYKFCPKCGQELVPVFNAQKYLASLQDEFANLSGDNSPGSFIDYLALRLYHLENKLKENRNSW